MEQFGYFGTFLLIMLENIFPPIPSEVILTIGGFMTTKTNMTVVGVVISSTLGSIAGSIILYGAGHLMNVSKLEKFIGRFGYILKIKIEDIHKANSWFTRYGCRTVFLCRMIPLIRSLISIPAGMASMNFSLFLIYTTLGTLIWNTLLVYTGSALGQSWERIIDFMDIYSSITHIILGLSAAVPLIIWLIKRNRKLKAN